MSLYGEIGRGGEIQSAAVNEALSDVDTDILEIYINSMGGDPFEGFAIANRMAKLQLDGKIKEIHTFAEAVVGSAATLPFLRGSKRVMLNGSRFFIHKGSTAYLVHGTMETLPTDEEALERLHSAREDLETTNREAAELYEHVSTLSAAEIDEAMEKSTSYSPSKAVAVGFATEAHTAHAVAACMNPQQLKFQPKNIPADVLEMCDYEFRARQIKAEQMRPSQWVGRVSS
jgi:ATP-dependent protease ClpP protease subunit